jgi:hypothetical protein
MQPPAHAGSSLADFSTLKMKAIRSSETSVHTRSTWHHIPEAGVLHHATYISKQQSLQQPLQREMKRVIPNKLPPLSLTVFCTIKQREKKRSQMCYATFFPNFLRPFSFYAEDGGRLFPRNVITYQNIWWDYSEHFNIIFTAVIT